MAALKEEATFALGIMSKNGWYNGRNVKFTSNNLFFFNVKEKMPGKQKKEKHFTLLLNDSK